MLIILIHNTDVYVRVYQVYFFFSLWFSVVLIYLFEYFKLYLIFRDCFYFIQLFIFIVMLPIYVVIGAYCRTCTILIHLVLF